MASNIDVADSVWRRFVGLMGRRELPAGHGLCIRPWRVTRIVRRAKAVLELPAGTVRTHRLNVGDMITLV